MLSMKQSIAEVVASVMQPGTKQAAILMSKNEVVKATFKGKRDRRARTAEIFVTIGRPNYEYREIIKTLCKSEHGFVPGTIRVKLEKKKK